jgi:hypothetical protein
MTVKKSPTKSGNVLTINNSGVVMRDAWLKVIFWGPFWTSGDWATRVYEMVRGVVSGPYLTHLRQYGINSAEVDADFLVNPAMPTGTIDVGAAVDMVWNTFIDPGAIPEPDEGPHPDQWIYCVFLDPAYTNTKALSAHGANVADYDFGDIDTMPAMYVRGDSNGQADMDTFSANFSHELAEALTDPDPHSGITISPSNDGQEICDDCGDAAYVEGVLLSSYWSEQDGACIIPMDFYWCVRAALAAKGWRLNGKGLRSLQDPIPSLGKFISNL